jgi:DNA-binding transcriptional MerR regulator
LKQKKLECILILAIFKVIIKYKGFEKLISNPLIEVVNLKANLKVYSSKDVAKRLLIEPVTVRKYSQMLEEQGYSFTKDEKSWRQYSEDDVRFLEYLCNLKSMGRSLDESVQHVATLYRSSLSISQSDISLQEEENPLIQFIKKQEEFNKKLLDRMDQRDKSLMAVIEELQETKKQIAAAKEKKWWQFWKR